MKVSDGLLESLATLEAAMLVKAEQLASDLAMEEDEAWMGPERGVKARFHELLEQHPELTRPQAYMQAVMEAGDRVIAETAEKTRVEIKAAMAMDDSLGGCLVPPEHTVEIAVRLGMPPLRDMLKWDIRVRAKIRDRSRWWQWLFHNYSTNKVAGFLVWRWPRFPDIVNIYNDCCGAHQEEKEHRTQKAYEFLRGWRKERENDNDHQADLD